MSRRNSKSRKSSDLSYKRNLLVEGRLDCHADGYGFVRPDQAGMPDVYVSGRNLGDAMHGDRVLARVTRRKSGNRLEGRIQKVIKRGTARVVGFFNGMMVIPRNGVMRNAVWIEPRDRMGAEPGEIVAAEIKRYPLGMSAAGGFISEVLGKEGDPEVESRAALYEHGFRDDFPEDAVEQASRIASRVRPSDIKGRKDLRDILTVTIDPVSARDFDDAVAVRKTRAGYTLWVSIADVSNYVAPQSPVDMEAYHRATSVYFPDRAYPMLPEKLSSGICSLNPRSKRLAMTAELRFDNTGKRTGFRFYASVIRSDYRLDYDSVKKILEGELGSAEKYSAIAGPLEEMRELAELRIKERLRRGSIDLDVPEAEIVFNRAGEVETIVRRERHIAHRMIEEFMLAANEAVAEFLSGNDGGMVYRIHEPPGPEAVSELDRLLGMLGLRLLGKKRGPERIKPSDYQRVVRASIGKPYEAAVNMLCLRSMMLARYSPENRGHFGLAAEKYCHFTSPIRRYPDLMVHRLLKSRLGISMPEGGPVAPEDISAASERCSERERAAERAEREMMDFYASNLMQRLIGETYRGTVSGVTSFGVFVQLDEPFVEGMIPAQSLSAGGDARQDIVFDEARNILRSRRRNLSFALGDRVAVKVEDVNLDKREIDFEYLKKV